MNYNISSKKRHQDWAFFNETFKPISSIRQHIVQKEIYPIWPFLLRFDEFNLFAYEFTNGTDGSVQILYIHAFNRY